MKAPSEITSDSISYFEMDGYFLSLDEPIRYSYVHCCACPVNRGVMVYLKYRDVLQMGQQTETVTQLKIVESGVLKVLDEIVKKYEFVKNNGVTHTVAGLPTGIGGRVDIKYVNGEFIYKSDNQAPVIPPASAVEIVDSVVEYMQQHTIPTTSCDEIQSIDFIARTNENSYHSCHIENNHLSVESKYQKGGDIIRKEKDIDPQQIEEIIQIIRDNLYLDCQTFHTKEKRTDVITLNIRLKNGGKKVVDSNMQLPSDIINKMYEIERRIFVFEQY